MNSAYTVNDHEFTESTQEYQTCNSDTAEWVAFPLGAYTEQAPVSAEIDTYICPESNEEPKYLKSKVKSTLSKTQSTTPNHSTLARSSSMDRHSVPVCDDSLMAIESNNKQKQSETRFDVYETLCPQQMLVHKGGQIENWSGECRDIIPTKLQCQTIQRALQSPNLHREIIRKKKYIFFLNFHQLIWSSSSVS